MQTINTSNLSCCRSIDNEKLDDDQLCNQMATDVSDLEEPMSPSLVVA